MTVNTGITFLDMHKINTLLSPMKRCIFRTQEDCCRLLCVSDPCSIRSWYARGADYVLEYKWSALWRGILSVGKHNLGCKNLLWFPAAGDTVVFQEWKRCSVQLPVTSSCLVQVSWTETRLTPTAVPKQAASPSVLSSPPWEHKSHPNGYELRSAINVEVMEQLEEPMASDLTDEILLFECFDACFHHHS